MTAERVCDRFSIVLVEPHYGGNIGSVARAMKNFGFQRLKLVSPREFLTSECRMMAGRAEDVAEQAKVYDSFDEAVADDTILIGTTSSRDRLARSPLMTPRQVTEAIPRDLKNQTVALIFGPERRGLEERHLARCRWIVSAPAESDYPVLNLSQAVLLLLYEIASSVQESETISRAIAPERERRELYGHMQRVLTQIGFLSAENPGHIMRVLQRLLSRAELDSREVKILRGIMSQIDWFQRVHTNSSQE